MSAVDLSEWFSHDELVDCPCCGERRALRLQTPKDEFLVCLDCGLLTPTGERLGGLSEAPRLSPR